MGTLGGGALFIATQQAELTSLNAKIRASAEFDGTMEFHDATADPANPENLNPPFDSGDGLHPNEAGEAAMAATIPLARF